MQTTTELLRAAHAKSPEQRKLMPVAGNAFRVLGLSCHASQKEIYAAASSLRRAIKLGVERPGVHHFAWLGSLAERRTENGVRDALSRLADPAQRIYERLFWFFDPQEVASAELSFTNLEESIARLRALNQPAAPHDIALLSLAAMLELDPRLLLADEWRRTYALWKELIDAREFWSLLMASDLKGDFEQLTTFGEIKSLRARAWRLVTSPVAEIAKDGILQADQELARRALDVLRLPSLPPALAHEYENEILGPVEDEFEVLFAEAFRYYRYEVKTYQTTAERRATCDRALGKFDSLVKPALKNIFELAGVESLVTRRVFQTAAEGLDELADGFETALDNASRLKTLRRAWLLAPPESAALLLIEEHLKAAGDVQERKAKTGDDYTRQITIALREPVAQAELFTSYIQKEDEAKKFEGCGTVIGKIALFLMFTLFVGKCFSNLPGSRRTSLPPSINFNVAMPRFTPTTIPKIDPSSFVLRISAQHLQAKLILKTAVVVDVGTKNEYDAGHIAGAISIPASEMAARARRLPKSKEIVLYCNCDGKQELSARAALELQRQGFLNVFVLEGGYQAWLDARLPVKKSK